jgi:thiosulfate/3-mercaptopyruvate sulfurtransferase
MTLKTGRLLLVLACLAAFAGRLAAQPLAGQQAGPSPLQWPVPPPGPPPEPRPPLLIALADLARALAAGALPLDVRGAGPRFAAGHLPGAVPAWSPGAEDADPKRLRPRLAAAGISGWETVILYGEPDAAGLEAMARWLWLLRRAGCGEVRILDGGPDGGLAAWRAAGGSLETGGPRRAAVAAFHPAGPDAAGVDAAGVDAAWIAGTLFQTGVQLLDVRDARGWERWATPPTFAAGHIPYSLPFDPAALLPAGGGWPEPGEFRRRLATLGPRPGDPVRADALLVLYGTDAADPRPALGYLLLTLAGREARIYPGGWREWRAGGSRPVVRVISAPKLADRLRRNNPGLADRPPAGLILLDLREARDFRIGHLPGARSLPFLHFSRDLKAEVRAGWPGADRATTPLVLYCYGTDCVRSRKGSALAAQLGFRDVLWFRGGIREWREAGYPLPETPPASSSPASPAPDRPPASPAPGSPAGADGRPSP